MKRLIAVDSDNRNPKAGTPTVAAIHAKEGGVILRLPTGKPPAGSPWKFEWSPDQWFEQEVLVRGPVYGAERYR